MQFTVISYSLTGNNGALAASLAQELSANHIKITESKPRTLGTIILDMMFNRTPHISPVVDKVTDNELVLFVGPVWMGHVAAPFRACLKNLKTRLGKYAFISISGGALGPNPKLTDELKKRVGKEPVAVINPLIANLMPTNPKPAMKDTADYLLNETEVKGLTADIAKTLRETLAN